MSDGQASNAERDLSSSSRMKNGDNETESMAMAPNVVLKDILVGWGYEELSLA